MAPPDDAPAWFPLELACFSARGPDRQRFLNGMVTADVASLVPGGGVAAFQLDHKGHIEAELVLLARAEELLGLCGASERDGLLARLDRFLIADQVELSAAEEWRWIAVEGPGTEEACADHAALPPAAPYAHAPWSDGLVVRASWTGAPGVWLGGTAPAIEALAAVLERAGLPRLDAAAIELARIRRGIPRHRLDFDETNLVQETGMLHAVSYRKGCYRGQETVERVRSRGAVQRQLTSLRIDGPPLPRGTPIESEGEPRPVGEIRSCVPIPGRPQSLALGYVRMAYRSPGTALRAGGLSLVVAAVPVPLEEAP